MRFVTLLRCVFLVAVAACLRGHSFFLSAATTTVTIDAKKGTVGPVKQTQTIKEEKHTTNKKKKKRGGKRT